MNAGNHPKALRACAYCGRQFAVNPRLGKRHRFCSRPACARASRRVAQKKWLKQWRKRNGGEAYFSGKAKLTKVRDWRQRNPGYWKRTSRRKNRQPAAFRLTKKLRAALRSVALPDVIDTPLALEIGIFSRLSGATLQDAIATEIRATMLRGHAILHGQPIPKTH